MRARAGIDRIGRGTTERDAIIITEIPFQVNKARLIERIAELVNEKKIDGIADLRDESSRDGMRIVVELKRDAVPQIVLNKLYKLTPMQSTFGVINLAIVNGQPRVLKLRQMLEVLHRVPPRGGAPPHRVRPPQGARPRTHPRRPEQGDRRARLHHPAHPQRALGGRGARSG